MSIGCSRGSGSAIGWYDEVVSVIEDTWKNAIESQRCNVSPIQNLPALRINVLKTLFFFLFFIASVKQLLPPTITLYHPFFLTLSAWHVQMNHKHAFPHFFSPSRSRTHTIIFLIIKIILMDIFLLHHPHLTCHNSLIILNLIIH